MRSLTTTIVAIVVMVALIVGLDIAFLRHHFALRLIANVGIVALFATAYLIRRPRA